MNLLEQVNQMGTQGLRDFLGASMQQQPDIDGPECGPVLTAAALTLIGVDLDSIEEMLAVLMDPELRALSGTANRAFIIGLRLAQSIIDKAAQGGTADGTDTLISQE